MDSQPGYPFRGIAATLLVFFLMGFGVVNSDLNAELSGAVLLALSPLVGAYFLVTWFLVRRKKIQLTPQRIRWEGISFALLVSACSLAAAFDAFPGEPFLVFLFSECFGLSLYAAHLMYKNNLVLKGNLTSWGSRKLGWWFFAIAVTITLLVMTAFEFEPVVNLLGFLYFLTLFALGVRWLFARRRELITLKREQTQMELVHLQSQVNPHFFFNALNNLYGLVSQDADKARTMILQLSDLMSYGIYEGQKEWVPLEMEVAYLDNFIRLHQMRYHKQVEVRFRQDLHTSATLVMPLIFINLIENAFKHGVEKLRDNAYVHLELKADDLGIRFTVENNFDPAELPAEPGIGLTNLRRRLELVYPGRHSLRTEAQGNFFKAELILQPV